MSIESSNYREVDIRIYTLKNDYYLLFFSIKQIFGVQDMCFYRQFVKQFINRSYSLNPMCPKFI